MPAFGNASKDRLATCHRDLQRLFKEVVKGFDCTVVSGWRSVQEQAALYAQGRTRHGSVVTYKDGVTKRSKHQGVGGEPPSLAIDVIPYPIDWQDTQRMTLFAGYVLGVASQLGIEVRWGGDWDGDTQMADERFRDFPHFEMGP